MPIAKFFDESHQRESFRLPEVVLQNMFVEATTAPTPYALLTRPALQKRFRLSTYPIRGIFETPGAFGSAVFIAAGNQLYNRGNRLTGTTSSVGSIESGFAAVRWAYSPTQMVVVSQGKVYCYSKVSGVFGVRLISDSDLPPVKDVIYIAGRFYYFILDSDLIYFSDLGDATSIDGLAFQAAESSADKTVGAVLLGDEIYVFGTETTEVFAQSSNADAPIISVQSRKFDKGCAAQSTIINHDNTLYFVGHDRIVYKVGAVPIRISTSGIEEALRQAGEFLVGDTGDKVSALTRATAMSLLYDGHAWYVLNIPGAGSFAYDSQTGKWAEWKSYGENRFRGAFGITASVSPSETWVGDYSFTHDDKYSGWLYRLSSDVIKDAGDPIERIATAAVAVESGSVSNKLGVMLQCVRGVGNEAESSPQVEMRYSDDQAQTWSPWDQRPLGEVGQYRNKAIWRRLGSMQSPGRAFQFRCSDPVISAFQAVSVNEERP